MDRATGFVFNGRLVTAAVALFVLFILFRAVAAHPLAQRSTDPAKPQTGGLHRRPVRSSTSRDINDNVLHFLSKFGYLPQSDLETGNLRTEDQVREAIKTMQAFAHLPATGVVDEATQELMRKPRCGLPDIISDSYRAKRSLSDETSRKYRHHASRSARKKRYTVQGQRWHHTNLTWSLRRGANTAEMDDYSVRYQIKRAFDAWQSSSRLTFTEVNRDDADIRISFHSGYHNDGYPFDGRGSLLAHAFFPGSGIGGDAHFDAEEPWVPDRTKPGTSHMSFFAVAVHEFGHSLGLSHSSVPGAVMYPYYQTIEGELKLSSDDVAGIQAIYGSTPTGRVTNPYLTTTTTTPRTKPELPTKATVATKKPVHPTKAPVRPDDRKPNTCDTSYDAISVIRRELFIFKDRYFWRIGQNGLEQNYPVEIDRFWNKLPSNLTHIDAIYERPTGKREMVIFIGKHYWIFPNNDDGQGPYPLTRLGLPESLNKIDGALVWGHNGKTYFFSGSMYWRYDEEAGSVELDYPRDMSMWKGVPYDIDAVFQYTNGKTYFFKGKSFYEFNDRRMRVVSETPSLSAPFWMSCPTGMDTVDVDVKYKPGEGRSHLTTSTSTASSLSVVNVLTFAAWILVTKL